VQFCQHNWSVKRSSNLSGYRLWNAAARRRCNTFLMLTKIFSMLATWFWNLSFLVVSHTRCFWSTFWLEQGAYISHLDVNLMGSEIPPVLISISETTYLTESCWSFLLPLNLSLTDLPYMLFLDNCRIWTLTVHSLLTFTIFPSQPKFICASQHPIIAL
jgi:hypothetical protein